jgi:hypothetical protein
MENTKTQNREEKTSANKVMEQRAKEPPSENEKNSTRTVFDYSRIVKQNNSKTERETRTCTVWLLYQLE